MLCAQTKKRRVSRQTTVALPMLEHCEPRQLLSTVQPAADLTVLRKHAPADAPAEVSVISTTALVSSVNTAIKHGA